MLLPLQQTEDQSLSLLQTKWKAIIDPLLSSPSNQANILSVIPLSNGTTVINHLLGRKLVGWRIIGINAAATVYDKQASNQTPAETLILVSNAACIVNLEVF